MTTQTKSAALMDLLTWFEKCRPAQVCSLTWLECQTALVEAYANVLEHAHRGMPAETPILIKLAIYRQAIQIQVWDHGPALDLLGQLQCLPDQVAVTAERGRGLLLLRRTMDDLTYFRSPDDCNCLMMTRLF
ncbi:MAG: ATP-binding protein [Elainella sp.]